MTPVPRQGDRRVEGRRESDRPLHYETMAVVAAAQAWLHDGGLETTGALCRAVDVYERAEAAHLKAES